MERLFSTLLIVSSASKRLDIIPDLEPLRIDSRFGELPPFDFSLDSYDDKLEFELERGTDDLDFSDIGGIVDREIPAVIDNDLIPEYFGELPTINLPPVQRFSKNKCSFSVIKPARPSNRPTIISV
jgi:hypothetical protein